MQNFPIASILHSALKKNNPPTVGRRTRKFGGICAPFALGGVKCRVHSKLKTRNSKL